MAIVCKGLLAVILTAGLWVWAGNSTPKFYSDDPIEAMPPPLPVKKTTKHGINATFDFLAQSFRAEPRPPTSASGVNTIGEVPDSAWFTNRHGRRRMSREELQRGPGSGQTPVPPYTIVGGKSDGITAGFAMNDAEGRPYLAKYDPIEYPELATSADVIVSRFLYAVGYNTPENEIVELNVSDLRIELWG